MSSTQIVMLGTGTPRPDPERSGPATAIIANGTPYLVDFGPGVIRRAAAAYQRGVTAIGRGVVNVTRAFLTHLHADHTAGYPDLILTPWIMGRTRSLAVFGPKGLAAMTHHVLAGWQVDIANRVNGIDRLPSAGCEVKAHEIEAGHIYEDDNVCVTAFRVRHGTIEDAFAFRFETPDKVIVISGDTAPAEAMVEHAKGCDVLIHEAYSEETFNQISPRWQEYRRKYHTSARELANLAGRINPGLLILYHRVNVGAPMTAPNPEQAVLSEICSAYRGEVVVGHDLDIY
jgi:ribonuclease BN (tRNA processing enzyme)